jgi:hypothetical protein
MFPLPRQCLLKSPVPRRNGGVWCGIGRWKGSLYTIFGHGVLAEDRDILYEGLKIRSANLWGRIGVQASKYKDLARENEVARML